MGRPAKNGIFDFRIRAQKCNKTCKDYEGCTIRLDPLGKCAKRDKREYYVKYVHIKQLDGSTTRKAVYGKTTAELIEKFAAYKEKYSEEKYSEEKDSEEKDSEEKDSEEKDSVVCETLGQWCDIWIKDYVSTTRLKPSTCKFYRSLIRYLTSDLRNKKLSELKPLDFERHFNQLREHGGKNGNGLSGKTLKSYRTMLIACVERAVDNDIVGVNAVKKTNAPELNQEEISYMTKDEMLRLMAVADSGEYYDELDRVKQDLCRRQKKKNKTKKDIDQEKRDQGILYLIQQWSVVIRLVLATGMRRGEIFGLTWSCVDFLNNAVEVRHNLQGSKLESPKTKNSIRTLCVDADTMQKLSSWKEYQSWYGKELGDLFINEMDLVFSNSFGRPVDYDNFRSRYFNRMVIKAGLSKKITFHGCRHSNATAMLALCKTDPRTVSQRLGHASSGVAFTLKTYTHVLHEIDRAAADAIGEILSGKKEDEDK